MKTIELDLEKDQRLDSLSGMLKNKKIKLGQEPFQLRINVVQSINNTLYASFLLLLANYLREERNRVAYGPKPDIVYFNDKNNMYYLFYVKTNDVNKLETKIEKDFKIHIAVEKKNPLDEVFGIWKEDDITLGKIREKAWQRMK
jgi:uncharacterized protein YlbG (UPF0298 family)